MMLAKARGRLGVTLKSLTRVNPRTIRLLKRLNTLAALGGNGRLARSREVTRLNRAGRTGSVDFDPEWLHVALHQQMQAPDGGWRAWSVVFGYFLVCFSTLGVQWAYSAIYGELLRALDEGPALTALVGSLCMGVMEGFAVLAALTISRFGSQRACQIGGVLAVAGLLLSAACTSVWQLCLTFGIITGLGHSLAFFSPIVLMPRWFNTKLTRAHALGNIGAALTPLVLGPVLPPMVATIGWQQMFLVLAAATALLLGLASALLIEPEESSRFSRIFSTTRRASRRPNSSRDSTGSSGSFTGGSGRFEGSILTPSPTRARIDTRARFARTPRSPQPEADAAEPVGADESGAAEAKLPKALGGVQRSHTELGIERGLALEQAGTLLMFLAAGSAGMRLPLAYAADWFGRQRTWAALLAVHAALDLVCASSFEFASSRPFLSGFAFGVGSLVGAMNSILVSLPSEMNLSPLASRLAVPIICSPLGAGMLVGPLIAGAIRSATSSYNDALLFAFACFVGAFGLYTASLLAECCSCTSEHAVDDDASENAADNGAPARARVDSASPVKAWMAASVGEQGSSTTSLGATRTRPRLKPVTV